MSHMVAHRLNNGKVRSMNLDHLLELCEQLRCTPNDLLNYKPKTGKVVGDHPLRELVRTETPLNPMDSISMLPLDKVEELQKFIRELSKA